MLSIDERTAKIRSDFERDAGSRNDLIELLKIIINNPTSLTQVSNYANLGRSCLLMLDVKISSNDETLEIISSVGFLFLTKAIQREPYQYNAIKDRLVLLQLGKEFFCYVVSYPLNIERGWMNTQWKWEAWDAIYRMEFADLQKHSVLHQIDFLKKRNDELEQMFLKKVFAVKQPREEVIKKGLEIQQKVFAYLDKKILSEGSLRFQNN